MTVQIYHEVKHKILKSVGYYKAESGGIIGCDHNNIIVDFYFDSNAGTGQISYVPSRNAINKQVNHVWFPLGYSFGGIVHSHPEGTSVALSNTDIKTAEKIMLNNHLDGIILIIVQNRALTTWHVSMETQKNLQIELCELIVLHIGKIHEKKNMTEELL